MVLGHGVGTRAKGERTRARRRGEVASVESGVSILRAKDFDLSARELCGAEVGHVLCDGAPAEMAGVESGEGLLQTSPSGDGAFEPGDCAGGRGDRGGELTPGEPVSCVVVRRGRIDELTPDALLKGCLGSGRRNDGARERSVGGERLAGGGELRL